jgi:hypothetical protein
MTGQRSELKTGRCKGRGGCGKWLIKYDPATRQVLRRNRGVEVSLDRWPDRVGDDGRPVLDDYGAWPWYEHPDASRLVAQGVMIEPETWWVQTEPGAQPPTHREVRCSCGKTYKIPPSGT